MLWKIVETKVGRYLFLAYTWAFVTARWLLTKPVGMLTTMIILYWLAPALGVKPLTLGQLAILFEKQDAAAKQAVGSSMLTITGFLVALTTANAAWKSQRRIELRIAASEEIYLFFEQISDDLLKIELYAESIAETQKLILSPTSNAANVEYQIQYLLQNTEEMNQARKRVSRMAITVHSLGQKHQLVTSQQLMASACFDRAGKALDEASIAMWQVIAPAASSTLLHAKFFIEGCDDEALRKVAKDCGRCRAEISSSANALRGLVLGEVVRPTFATAIKLTSLTKFLNNLPK